MTNLTLWSLNEREKKNRKPLTAVGSTKAILSLLQEKNISALAGSKTSIIVARSPFQAINISSD